ncbi:MAG: hypothetical protein SFV51_02065 [Bryobacteraceae bacterium]|nr:hypothetical protein [Bryobacteraceae bacterium]
MVHIHCRFCGRFLSEKILRKDYYCSPDCRMKLLAGIPPIANRRHAIKAALVSSIAYFALRDPTWSFRFDDKFVARDWTDSDGKPSAWKFESGYAVPEALSLFQPSAGLLNGHLHFDVRVGRSVGFAVRAQNYKRPAYYSVGLRNTGKRLSPLQLEIAEVHRNRARTIQRVELDTLSSLNRSQMHCAVSLVDDQIAAYVDGKLVCTWRDRIGEGSGAVGLIPPEGRGSYVLGGLLVAANITREKLESGSYRIWRELRQRVA